MTNRELASLAIKLVGLYCLIQVVLHIAGASYMVLSGQMTIPALGLFYAVLSSFVALGALLIWKSEWFVRLVLAARKRPGPDEETEQKRLQPILFSVVGVVLVVQALPQVSFTISRYLFEEDRELGWQWPHLTGLAVQMLLGVALFLGSGGLARVWRRINEMNQWP